MTREDIIRMAREAGLDIDSWEPLYKGGLTGFGVYECTHEELERFAQLVAFAEREACAEICKKHADVYAGLEQNPTAKSAWAACIDNRDAIKARGQA